MMIKTTIKTIASEKIRYKNEYRIYFVKEANNFIYIGQSINVIKRLQTHFGFIESTKPDKLGNLFINNYPESLNWQIVLLTCDECELIARRHYPSLAQIDINLIEQALISEYHPLLNTQHNIEEEQFNVINYQKLQNNEVNPTKINFKTRNTITKTTKTTNAIERQKDLFSAYRSNLSKHTIRSQLFCLNKFSQFVNISINKKNNLNEVFDFNIPESWILITNNCLTGFVDSLLSSGVAISSINLYIRFIKKYVALVYNARIIDEKQYKKIIDIKKILDVRKVKLDSNNLENSNGPPLKINSRVAIMNSYQLSDKEAKLLKNSRKKDLLHLRNNLIMCLLLDQGLDQLEILNLRFGQIDFHNKTLITRKGNNNQQIQKLTKDTFIAIKKWIVNPEQYQTDDLVLTRVIRGNKVIPNPIRESGFFRILRKLGNEIGISNLGITICKSYWLKTKLSSGMPLYEIQEVGGYSTILPILRQVAIDINNDRK